MKVLIWDSPLICEKSKDYDIIIQWQISTEIKNSISIPLIAEKYDYKYRQDLLLYFFELSELTVKGKKNSEHLLLNGDISYWWMTRLSEKRNFDISKNIVDIIYLLVFKDYISKINVTSIEVFTHNWQLSEVIQKYCFTKKIEFKNNKKKYFKLIPKNEINIVKKLVGSMSWFVYYLFSKCILFGQNVFLWKNHTSDYLFFSYFNNIDTDEINTKNSFKSTYWGSLPGYLKSHKISHKWIHIWTRSKEVSNVFKYKTYLKKLNKDSQNGVHISIDSFFNFKITYKVFINWITIMRKAVLVKKSISKFKFSEIEFWPLICDDFNESFFGKTALKNIINLHLIDNALCKNNKVKFGIYLQENQIWEVSLISVFKKYSLGKIIGFPNTIIRFWDLRYFHHYFLYESNNKFSLPVPDYIAVNGIYNKRMLLNAKMYENQLINVEALRYEYLHAFSSDKNLIMNSSKNFNLLVLGDYLYNNTDEMISILKSSNYLLNSNITICFKPHPSCDYPIKQKLNNQKITISRTHLSVLLGNADIVFTSSLTSASLDCFIFGSKLITIRSKSGLNLSPLREVKGISVVSTSEEFDEAFAFYLNNSQSISENKINDFFYQDPNLSRWKKLLQL